MKKLFKLCKVNLLAFLTPEPEIQQEYVDKMVILLRRDFTTTQQNEIIVSVAKQLSELREKDMERMTIEYDILQKDTNHLKNVILC